jgi:hypothetical protein
MARGPRQRGSLQNTMSRNARCRFGVNNGHRACTPLQQFSENGLAFTRESQIEFDVFSRQDIEGIVSKQRDRSPKGTVPIARYVMSDIQRRRVRCLLRFHLSVD